jgi:hypothetical protein
MVNQKTKPIIDSSSFDYLEVITPDQAHAILSRLVNSNPNIKLEFDQMAKDLIGSLDIDEIGEEIYSSLDDIEIEDVWYRAGKQRDGEYKDPYDIIVDDIMDILDPFVSKIDSYIQEDLFFPANILCKGILKGLYDFETSSGSEILNELADGLKFIAQNEIVHLLDNVKVVDDPQSITNFIQKDLPNWKL